MDPPEARLNETNEQESLGGDPRATDARDTHQERIIPVISIRLSAPCARLSLGETAEGSPTTAAPPQAMVARNAPAAVKATIDANVLAPVATSLEPGERLH